MAYPNHQLLQLSGTFGAGGNAFEIWSTGIRTVASLTSSSGGTAGETLTVDEQEEYMDFIETYLETNLENADFLVAGNQVRVNQVKFNSVDANGRYIYDETTARDLADLPLGSVSAQLTYPTQVSKVLTLETGYSRGVAHRGRLYIPGPTNALSVANGTMTLTQNEVDAWAAFIGGMGTTLTSGGRSVIVEPAVVSSIGTGFGWRQITGVSMDSRLDVQRRRANDIRGTRLSANLP